MMLIVAFFFISAYYVSSDLIPIYQEKQWKTFWIYSAMITLALFFTILVAMDVPIPSPSIPIKKIIYSIFGL